MTRLEELILIAKFSPLKIKKSGFVHYYFSPFYNQPYLSQPFEIGTKFENGFARVKRKDRQIFEYLDLMGNLTITKTQKGEVLFNYMLDLIHYGITFKAIDNIPYEYFSDEQFTQCVLGLFEKRYISIFSKGIRMTHSQQLKLKQEGITLAQNYLKQKLSLELDEYEQK
ncbi:MAG: hypothetical protein E7379_03760 [Clostridiales bacterium]|nr:hypothetical protein [Clostridiales bacterium]